MVILVLLHGNFLYYPFQKKKENKQTNKKNPPKPSYSESLFIKYFSGLNPVCLTRQGD